jgi:hypothetical protein
MPDAAESSPLAPQSELSPAQAAIFKFWAEEDALRATMLQCVDDPRDREMIRSFGTILHALILKRRHLLGTTPEVPQLIRSNLAAVVEDLWYVQGYLDRTRFVFEKARPDPPAETNLDPADEALARFASDIALDLAHIIGAIREQLRDRGPGPAPPMAPPSPPPSREPADR